MGRIGHVIQREQMVDSTQIIVAEQGMNLAEEGLVVTAEEQTVGRGRMGRKWYGKPGDSLAMSILLRPQLPLEKFPQLTLVAAVAIVQAIEEVTGVKAEIKWPNDILLNGKKFVGILTEANQDKEGNYFVVLGIGINVGQAEADFPEEIKDIATSLSREVGRQVEKQQVFQVILHHLEARYRQYVAEDFAQIKEIWQAYAISIGQEIIARTKNEVIYGKALGITDDGLLLLKDKRGNIQTIYAADIELKL